MSPHLLRPFLVGVPVALGVHLALAVPLAWALGVFGVGLPVVLAWVGSLAGRHEVLAVRADEDFGRLALLDHGCWEGAAPLAGASRSVDVEIEASGDAGPTLGQRLAYQNACADLPGLLPQLAEGAQLDEDRFAERARFLRLYLPDGDQQGAPDWSLSFTVDETGARCFEVDVRGGEVAALRASRTARSPRP